MILYDTIHIVYISAFKGGGKRSGGGGAFGGGGSVQGGGGSVQGGGGATSKKIKILCCT